MFFRAVAVLTMSLAATQGTAQDLDLVNATLVDGTGAEPRTGVAVSVRGGRIAAIADRAPAAAPGVRLIDLKGRYLMPGLIDAHAHIESPAAALNGARLMGIESRTGTIRVGLEADLVAYDGNPLEDATMLFEPRLIVSDGNIAVEGLGL